MQVIDFIKVFSVYFLDEKSDNDNMKTKSENQVALVNARQELESAVATVKAIRARIKDLTVVVKTEKAINRTAAIVARDAKLEAKREADYREVAYGINAPSGSISSYQIKIEFLAPSTASYYYTPSLKNIKVVTWR